MVVRDDRQQADNSRHDVSTCCNDPARLARSPSLGLYPGPLYFEPIAVQPDRAGDREILLIAVIAVCTRRPRAPCKPSPAEFSRQPTVGVDVVAFALVGGDRRAPRKPFGILRQDAPKPTDVRSAAVAANAPSTSRRVVIIALSWTFFRVRRRAVLSPQTLLVDLPSHCERHGGDAHHGIGQPPTGNSCTKRIEQQPRR